MVETEQSLLEQLLLHQVKHSTSMLVAWEFKGIIQVVGMAEVQVGPLPMEIQITPLGEAVALAMFELEVPL